VLAGDTAYYLERPGEARGQEAWVRRLAAEVERRKT
jgi:hypothetical protein